MVNMETRGTAKGVARETMIIGYHIRGRDNAEYPWSDLLWGGVALVLEMYHKPLKLILVARIFWPINA